MKAAELAGVGERTGRRWLADPTFRAELGKRVDGVLSSSVARVVDVMSKAVNVIEDALDDPDVRIRLQAVARLKDFVALREVADLADRVSVLEERAKEG